MLKITYTEAAPYLEYLPQSIEDWVAHHIVLALRTGQPLNIEPGRASLLLPIGFLGAAQALLSEVTRSRTMYPAIAPTPPAVELSICDDTTLELSLSGLWAATSPDAQTGVFLIAHSPSIERGVLNLWRCIQHHAVSS